MTTNNLKKTKLADLKNLLKVTEGEQKLEIKAEIANKELIEYRKKQRAQAKAKAAAEKAEIEARETAAMRAIYPQYETIALAMMSFGSELSEEQKGVAYFITREIVKVAKTRDEVDAIMNTLCMRNYNFVIDGFGQHLQ